MVRWLGDKAIRNAIDNQRPLGVEKEASLPQVGLVYVLSGTVIGKLCSGFGCRTTEQTRQHHLHSLFE